MTSKPAERFRYPSARRADHVDEYHGTTVADPYRWLEDLDSPETAAWIAAENELSEAFLSEIPERAALRQRLSELWDFERCSPPARHGPHYVFSRNTGLQNQGVVYLAPALDASPRVLIDPNVLSEDGTVALTGLSFSDDGALAAYATSASGSDWLEWRVRDTATGEDRGDTVAWSKFSAASWRKDGSGFYYSRYRRPADAARFKESNYNHQLYFHRLGTDQVDDVLIYERPDHKDWNFSGRVSDDGRWLVIAVTRGTDPKNRIFVQDIGAGGPVIELLPHGDANYAFLGNDGARFYFLTTLDAPRGRIVAVEIGEPAVVELVPQTGDALQDAALFGDRLILLYLHDAYSVVKVRTLDGSDCGRIALPGFGTVGGFHGKRDATETFFSFTSYTMPATTYRYDVSTGATTLVFAPRVTFEPDAFVTEQIFFASKDGTRVPMFVSSKRGVARDGTAPAILYGYGGFDIALTPAFSPAMLLWLEMGGVYAIANLRGGGEYGEAWHLAGTLERKQNTFDDFFAAAEYLIAQRRTSTRKLAIAGGSNGGLLVGAAMTQRPDLFAAALPSVAVMDMLRFQQFTIGWAWASDYGSSDDAEQFRTLLAYSPLHNLKAGVAYPATLITTADHDDRVFPAHSFKFAAQLQHVQSGDAPTLIRIESKAGHGAGKPTAKLIAEAADRHTFLVRVLDVKLP
ncbi:MAG: prolyl oligopeptidase family protein [Candidatus Velthaea sp.]